MWLDYSDLYVCWLAIGFGLISMKNQISLTALFGSTHTKALDHKLKKKKSENYDSLMHACHLELTL